MAKKYVRLRMDDLDLHYKATVQAKKERKTMIEYVQDALRIALKKGKP